MRDQPTDGDVLITIETGRYLLSIVPHPHTLCVSHFDAAIEIARRWAREHDASVWRHDGEMVRLDQD
jgi:hypothetical protein